MSHRINLQSAFILHRRPFRNTSFILEVLTRQYGRVAILARSARGLKSRYKGRLELFTPMLMSWSGRSDLKLLGDAELDGMLCPLEGDRLACGFYLNELLLRLLPHDDPHRQLFDDYYAALRKLLSGNVQVALRWFEKKLLYELGYGLSFPYNIVADQYYQYLPERGFMPVAMSTGTTTFIGTSLLALRDECFDDERSLQDAKRLMRIALGRLLGNKSLKSRELLT